MPRSDPYPTFSPLPQTLASRLTLAPSMYKTDLAVILSAALLDMWFFGLVGQQYYLYWIGRFNDRTFLKLFVNVQFVLVALQSFLMWNLVYKIFVDYDGMPPTDTKLLWTGPVNSLCQLFIIILANTFLVARIHGLTKSLVQSLTPMFFSIIAFVFGMVTLVASAWTNHSQSYKYTTSVIWYTSQTIAECLISFFLVRALLKARSGMKRSDSVVRCLIRNAIQTAALATIWSLAALVSWFWLKHVVIYSIFDITSGTVYTHAIFDTLLSRAQLRDRMATTGTSAYFDMGFRTQSHASGRLPGNVIVSNIFPALPSNSDSDFGTSLVVMNENIEPPARIAGVPYEF